MKNKSILALALVSVLSVSALLPAAFAATGDSAAEATVEETQKRTRHGRRGGEKVAEPEGAVGKDAAKSAALADAGVTAEQAGKVKSRVSQLDDGTVIYKVRFTCDGQRYSYQIDAATGAVLDKTVEEATAEDAAVSAHGHGRRGGEKVAEPEGAVGKVAAKTAALADAGVTAEQAGKVKSRVSQLDDGTVIYKVRFTCDGQRYSYQIDAATGAVLDKTVEEATAEDAAVSAHGHGRRGGKGKTAKAATVDEAAAAV